MARDVEANVNVNDNSDRGLRSFHANMTKADREAQDLQRELDKAARATGKFGSAADSSGRQVAKLTGEIEIAKRELGSLARAFADADNAADRMDISKAMRRQQAEIRNLTKNKDLLEGLVPAIPSSGIAGSLQTALVTGAAAAAPAVGALMSAAVIGGAGAAGVAGGLALVAKDERVQAAFKGFTSRLESDLQNAAVPFIDKTLDGIDQIEAALGTIDFDGIFDQSSDFLGPLTDGLSEFIEEVGDGLETLIANGGPVIDALGEGLGTLGESLGSAMETIAGGSEDAGEALGDFFTVLGAGIEVTAWAIRGLTELYGVVSYIPSKIIELQESLGLLDEGTESFTARTAGAESGIDSFRAALEGEQEVLQSTTASIDQLRAAKEELTNTNRSLYGAETDAAAAIAETNRQLKENGKGLSVNTEKGRENREALESLAGSLGGYYSQLVNVDGLTPAVVAKGDQLRASFIRSAQAAGYSAGEAKNLANQILGIPDSHDTKITAKTEAALEDAREVRRAIGDIPDSKTVNVNVKVNGLSRLNRVNNQLARTGAGAFSDAGYMAAEASGGRTQPATQAVAVTTDVNMNLNTDLFYATVDSRIDNKMRADNHSRKYGRK